jgi:hypothetical protein
MYKYDSTSEQDTGRINCIMESCYYQLTTSIYKDDSNLAAVNLYVISNALNDFYKMMPDKPTTDANVVDEKSDKKDDESKDSAYVYVNQLFEAAQIKGVDAVFGHSLLQFSKSTLLLPRSEEFKSDDKSKTLISSVAEILKSPWIKKFIQGKHRTVDFLSKEIIEPMRYYIGAEIKTDVGNVTTSPLVLELTNCYLSVITDKIYFDADDGFYQIMRGQCVIDSFPTFTASLKKWSASGKAEAKPVLSS